VREGKKESERERKKEKKRERERESDRKRERARARTRATKRDRETHRERHRGTACMSERNRALSRVRVCVCHAPVSETRTNESLRQRESGMSR